jgi:signal transduction histidine kinase
MKNFAMQGRMTRTVWPNLVQRLSLAQRFLLATLLVLVVSMVGLGWWVGKQIEIGVINRTSGDTALYVDSFIDPPLQILSQGSVLPPANIETLNQLVKATPLGQHVVAFKIWDTHGRIVYSTNPALIGKVYPLKPELVESINGSVTSDISDLKDVENLFERGRWKRLLETYSPVTEEGTNQVIAVAEFYQTVEPLDAEIQKAQFSSWLLFGGATIVIYLLLSVFVRGASSTITRQRRELRDQVTRLTELLIQNQELDDRVRRAASRSTTLNERFLRRISAELHDGPAQDLGYSLLRMDGVIAHAENPLTVQQDGYSSKRELEDIQDSLQRAMQEIRAISAGMGLPELDQLSLPETLERAVRAHERRTNKPVNRAYGTIPDQACLPSKITLYRVIQEALNNSFRHAAGIGQKVQASSNGNMLDIEVSDLGPGFDIEQRIDQEIHLGLSGIRERVESLGGLCQIISELGKGTRILARIPLQAVENNHER